MGGKKQRQRNAAPVNAREQQHADLKLDTRGDGMYSGSFRWLESKQFPRLPAFPSVVTTEVPLGVDLRQGWNSYLTTRGSNLLTVATKDPSCLDALSFPISFVHVAHQLGLLRQTGHETTHILVLGATRKAEQRIWMITDYWSEISHCFPQRSIVLWFIGPEVDPNCPATKPPLPKSMRVQHFRGTFRSFRDTQAASDCTPSNTILIAYNTGFGNFVDSNRHDLLFSWLPDLYAIADSNLPAIFTCANDYADMNGEFAVQSRIVGSKMLLLPQQNPFSAASHLHEEGKRETSWSRANSFLYAIQGCDSSRRVQLKAGDLQTLETRLDADLDLQLTDALGREFRNGTVLSKDQAAARRRTQGTPSASINKQTTVQANGLETPHFELRPGSREKELVVAVLLPKVASPSEAMAVDVSDSTLTVFVPGKYLLQLQLPCAVQPQPLGAQLKLPWLRVMLQGK